MTDKVLKYRQKHKRCKYCKYLKEKSLNGFYFFHCIAKDKPMIKLLLRSFCKHKRVYHLRTDLIRQNDGSFKTCHIWKCKRCGKEICGDGIK